jgi:hypothetical protein
MQVSIFLVAIKSKQLVSIVNSAVKNKDKVNDICNVCYLFNGKTNDHTFRSNLSLKFDLLFYFIFLLPTFVLHFLWYFERSVSSILKLTYIFKFYSLYSLLRSLSLGKKVLTCLRSMAVLGLLFLEGSLNRNSFKIYLEKLSCFGRTSTKDSPLIILLYYFVYLVYSRC